MNLYFTYLIIESAIMYNIDIKILNNKITNFLPQYATHGSAGLDLRACVDNPIVINSMQTTLIPSGIAIHIADPNLCGIIIPRSGLGHNHGIILGNLVGLIDSDYQGELKISVWNRSNTDFVINPLDRIAQLVIMPIIKTTFNIVDEFTQNSKNINQRGNNGFGSTGYQ